MLMLNHLDADDYYIIISFFFLRYITFFFFLQFLLFFFFTHLKSFYNIIINII